MTRSALRLVWSQPPEAVVTLRLVAVWRAWVTLCASPFILQSWFAWFSALERLEAEKLRFVHQPKRRWR